MEAPGQVFDIRGKSVSFVIRGACRGVSWWNLTQDTGERVNHKEITEEGRQSHYQKRRPSARLREKLTTFGGVRAARIRGEASASGPGSVKKKPRREKSFITNTVASKAEENWRKSPQGEGSFGPLLPTRADVCQSLKERPKNTRSPEDWEEPRSCRY